MSTKGAKPRIVTLAEMPAGEECDVFVLLTSKDELPTRDGKKYFKVAFRDAGREVFVPVWQDSPHAEACREQWAVGRSYKLRGTLRETQYGPQLDIRRIRETSDDDAADGFDPHKLRPAARLDPEAMHAELLHLARNHIADPALAELVTGVLSQHRTALLGHPASTRRHHAHPGGLLEHTLNTTRAALWLVEANQTAYPDLKPPLSRDLVVAGAILHDFGKLREIAATETGGETTPEGELVGHVLLGRDMLREAAVGRDLPAETLLRLEHILTSHHGTAEYGSPKPPMTPEALVVHAADDLDVRLAVLHQALREDPSGGPLTSNRNSLQQRFYRGQG
ncbi:MAG TPA: HD domain-containing protein [Pirellulales bacterium]